MADSCLVTLIGSQGRRQNSVQLRLGKGPPAFGLRIQFVLSAVPGTAPTSEPACDKGTDHCLHPREPAQPHEGLRVLPAGTVRPLGPMISLIRPSAKRHSALWKQQTISSHTPPPSHWVPCSREAERPG